MFASLTLRQKLTIAAVAILALVGLSYTMRWRKEQDFKTLYTGLAPEDSAAVVQKIKESGTEYRLSDAGDMISVPSSRLADLRIELAGAGLPKTGRIGFEIFDKSNLGATEFVEHVNYRRALEGELERSVSAMAEVEQARVHVTFPKESVFTESREPAKASVIVKLKPGNRLSPRNVTALTHLLSSAVEGLTPDSVSVLDMQGNLLSDPRPSNPDEAASEAALDYRQKIEHDLLQKIGTTLDPLLGHEKYRASVSVDCDLTSGEQSEESLDPERSVMVSSQKTEEASGSAAAPGGIPGTASNLQKPAPRPAGPGNSTTHRTENITLPDQPHRPHHQDPARRREKNFHRPAAGSGRAMGRRRQERAAHARPAHARSHEVDSGRGDGRGGVHAESRPDHGGKSARLKKP